ncbi:hypothetical protein L7F22_013345 [Adiantum nelumboides]|nr:hypothetical protein [Adiantum nelumboides]
MSQKTEEETVEVSSPEMASSVVKAFPLANKMSKGTNNRFACFEEEMKAWKIVVDEWTKERAALLRERDVMKQEINDLKAEVASLRDRSPSENGEIVEVKEAMKEEITKAIVETIEIKTKAMAVFIEGKMDAKKEGWVEVVRKNLRKEVKEEAKKGEHFIIQTTIEEEKMRQARRLNVRMTDITETLTSSPEEDAKDLYLKLGYKSESLPFAKVWRARKDTTKKRALILHFVNEEERTIIMKKRVALRVLQGPPIYLDDDLTRMQVEHRRACMPQVLQARKEGKRAIYRDGRVIIDGKAIH